MLYAEILTVESDCAPRSVVFCVTTKFEQAVGKAVLKEWVVHPAEGLG